MISPEVLRSFPYFADVSDASIRDVAMIAEEETYPAGTTVFQEGDKAEKLYIITEGEIDIQYALGSGELRTVDTVVAREIVMWSAIVEPFRATGTGTTRQETKVVAVDGKQLRELCEKDHDLGYRMLISITQMLAARLEGARVQLATID